MYPCLFAKSCKCCKYDCSVGGGGQRHIVSYGKVSLSLCQALLVPLSDALVS